MGGTGGGLEGQEEKVVRGPAPPDTYTQGSRAAEEATAAGGPFTLGTSSSLWPSGLRTVFAGPEVTAHPPAGFTWL